MWLDPNQFDCRTCSTSDRLARGHDGPAPSPVLWLGSAGPPDGFYSDSSDPARLRCPKLAVTANAGAVLDLYLASKRLNAPPLAGGVVTWPAQIVQALLLLESEYGKRRSEAEKHHADEMQRKAWTR